jgi:hypothetical protein
MKPSFTQTIIKTLALLCLCTSITHAGALDKHLWKNRVIIIFSDTDLSKQLAQHKSDLTDRHIIYYQITSTEKTITNLPSSEPLTAPQLKAIRNKYLKDNTIQNKATQSTILIGKDGKFKKRYKKLDLTAIFALIDTMPMRQSEMRQNVIKNQKN